MNENEPNEETWRQQRAEQEEQWKQRALAEGAFWKERAASQQDEVGRQYNLMYSGLIAVGIVMLQPFLTVPPNGLDLTAKLCVIAFSIAIPILASLVVLNSQEIYRRRTISSGYVQVARQGALGLGFVGMVAGLWHITPIAGVAALVAAAVALSVYTVGYGQVEREDARAGSEGGGEGGRPE